MPTETMEILAYITFWVVTTREQIRDWSNRVDPVDPVGVLEDEDPDELARRFAPYVVVEATSVDGRVYRYRGGQVPPAGAEAFIRRVEARGTLDLRHWEHWRTEYGSEAYIRDDVETQVLIWERGMDGVPGYGRPVSSDLHKCM